MKFIDMILAALGSNRGKALAGDRRIARKIATEPRNQEFARTLAENRRDRHLRKCQRQAYAAKAALVREGKGHNSLQGIPAH